MPFPNNNLYCLPVNWSDNISAPVSLNFLEKNRILLVEDVPLIQYVHKAMLTNLECSVDIACSGEEALVMARDHDYSLIFLDIGLPGINGIETAQGLRLLKRHERTRLIALTAHYDCEYTGDCISATGIEQILPKPTDMEKFKSVIFNL